MNQDQNQAPEQGTEDQQPIVTMNSVMEMAEVLAKWHQHKVNVLKYIRDIPEGSITELDGVKREFSGDFREGVILGINLALNELGVLPFVMSTEDAPQNG